MSEDTKVEITDSGQNKETVDGAQNAPGTEKRPEWLPEKFKTPEQMAEAYGELEKKQGGWKPLGNETPTKAPQITKADDDGAYFSTYENEFAEKGELSEDSYKQLAKDKGLNKVQVDRYIAGVQAETAKITDAIYETAGSKDGFEKMADWAGKNVDDTTFEAINDLLKGSPTQAKAGAQLLRAEYEKANGRASHLVNADGVTIGAGPYDNYDQVMEDMKNPKYQTDPAFRKRVEDRLRISDNI